MVLIATLYKDAINAAIDSGWNCDYDIISVIISRDFHSGIHLYTGFAAFQSYFYSYEFDQSFDYENWFGGYVVKEREDLEWGGGHLDTTHSAFAHIGIHCHEMFHVLGWGIPEILGEGEIIWQHPSAYDYSLMSTGYRTGPLRKCECPVDLDPAARIALEWAVPTEVNSNLQNESITYIEEDDNIYANFDYYQFYDPITNFYYIVENRQYSGFNEYLPGWWKAGTKGGLLIWRRKAYNRYRVCADNDTADTYQEGMPYVSGGDLGDPFPGATSNTAITPYTTPSTNIGTPGTFTGVAVTDISASSTTMTADLWADFPPDAPDNLDIANPYENDENPILEWDANIEPDLDHYIIYRGVRETEFDPIYWSQVATTANTTWTDEEVIIDTESDPPIYYRIAAEDTAGQKSDYSNSVNVGGYFLPKPNKPVSLNLPETMALFQNYPNPFNPGTYIRFDLPQSAHVSLRIYNILGAEVRSLIGGNIQAGQHSIRWDGRDDRGNDVSSGIYIYRLLVNPNDATDSFVAVKKLTLLR